MSSPSIAVASDDLAQRDPADPALELRIVHAAMDLFRVRAFHAVTLELVAQEADLPIEVVRDRFPGLDDLAVTTARVWHGERIAPIIQVAEEDGAVAFLRAIVVANLADPALMRLLLALTNISATPGHPSAPHLQAAWVQFHAHVQRTLARDVEVGREPDTMEPAFGAEQLIAMFEGLQVQLTMRPHMDLLASYDRGVARLRDGWAAALLPPVWEI